MNSNRNFSTSNVTLPVSLGVGLGVGVAIYCAIRARRNRNNLLTRTRRQASDLARQMAGVGCAAADLLEKGREEIDRQTKGISDAVEAGKRAYQRSVA